MSWKQLFKPTKWRVLISILIFLSIATISVEACSYIPSTADITCPVTTDIVSENCSDDCLKEYIVGQSPSLQGRVPIPGRTEYFHSNGLVEGMDDEMPAFTWSFMAKDLYGLPDQMRGHSPEEPPSIDSIVQDLNRALSLLCFDYTDNEEELGERLTYWVKEHGQKYEPKVFLYVEHINFASKEQKYSLMDCWIQAYYYVGNYRITEEKARSYCGNGGPSFSMCRETVISPTKFFLHLLMHPLRGAPYLLAYIIFLTGCGFLVRYLYRRKTLYRSMKDAIIKVVLGIILGVTGMFSFWLNIEQAIIVLIGTYIAFSSIQLIFAKPHKKKTGQKKS